MAFSHDPVELYQNGFGSFMLSVAPPDGVISPYAKGMNRKDMGKIPAVLTSHGWKPRSVYGNYCPDLATAQLWRDGWGANAGFVVGQGRLGIDNDQGAEFSRILFEAIEHEGVEPLRRFVAHAKHARDLFFLDVKDFVGLPALIGNEELAFKRGIVTTRLSVLAQGKQFVCYGTHPGTRAPYVWSHKLTGPEVIPQISDSGFERVMERVVSQALAAGWVLERPRLKTAVSAAVSAPATAGQSNLHPMAASSPGELEEVKFLLLILPNVDKPDAQKNALDRYLDVHVNYVEIAYAIFGALGDTSEAQALWIRWALGRAQGQDPEVVWRSVTRSNPRTGIRHLVELAQQYAPKAWTRWLMGHAPDPPAEMLRTLWDDFRERWGFCETVGDYVDLVTCDFIQQASFNWIHQGSIELLWVEKYGKPPKKYPPMATFFHWQADRRIVRNITYAPGDPQFVMLRPDDVYPCLNRWRAPALRVSNVQASEIQIWLDHIVVVLGSIEERNRFLRWAAFVVQHPREKPNWHWLVMTPQGGGKDTMVGPLIVAVGLENAKPNVGVTDLASNFNEYLASKLIVVGETRQLSRIAHDVSNKLKPMLAAPPLLHEINPKYGRKFEVANRNAVIMFSNEENPVYLEENQRRIHVINQLPVKPQPPAYFDGITKWLDQGGSDKCAGYLREYPLTIDIESEMKGRAPDTDAKRELELMNKDPLSNEIDELIADARGGNGQFASLVATQSDILAAINGMVGWRPSRQMVGRYLLQLEHKDMGVLRARRDPDSPIRAGVVAYKGESARLWLLGPKAPDGRFWKDWTDRELIAAWKGKPVPQSATVIDARTRFKNAPPPQEIV